MPWLILGYVVLVLLVDGLAIGARGRPFGINWRIFLWRADGLLAQFDYFKFLFWLVVPLLWCAVMSFRVRGKTGEQVDGDWMRWDWGYFGFSRWKRIDIYLLIASVVIGVGCVLAILFIPALRDYYPSASDFSWGEKMRSLRTQLLWNVSWLPGWEFMHRYFLLRPLTARWPRWGWIAVPVLEAAYHIQKDPLEMAAMFVAGVFFTWWTVRRKNIMLPFILHGSVEVGLMAFLVLV